MTRKRTLQGQLRFEVWRRDHGLCAGCHRDCEALRKRLRAMGPEERRLERLRLGIPEGLTTLWQAHHVVPFSEGGLDLVENATTLCFRFHHVATGSLAGERAAAGRYVCPIEIRAHNADAGIRGAFHVLVQKDGTVTRAHADWTPRAAGVPAADGKAGL